MGRQQQTVIPSAARDLQAPVIPSAARDLESTEGDERRADEVQISRFARDDSRRIRQLRGSKPVVDAWKAHGSVIEDERRPDGRVERALTVFLAGAECPFTCSFCDLWRYTIDGANPAGALVAQLRE